MSLDINKHVHSFLRATVLAYFLFEYLFQNKCLQDKYIRILLGKIPAQVNQHLSKFNGAE